MASWNSNKKVDRARETHATRGPWRIAGVVFDFNFKMIKEILIGNLVDSN